MLQRTTVAVILLLLALWAAPSQARRAADGFSTRYSTYCGRSGCFDRDPSSGFHRYRRSNGRSEHSRRFRP